MIANWTDLDKIVTASGDLTLNAPTGNRYLTLNERCDSGADLRVTFDNIPQGDGQLNHRQYLTGYKMRLALALWADTEPACGEDAQGMLDTLGQHINALRGFDENRRVVWTPEGMASRMINEINLMEKPVVTVEPGGTEGIVTVTFGVVSPFPYEMSEMEQTPATIADGATETLTNAGSTPFWPVYRVNGATSAFTITNVTTGEVIVYNGTAIGAMSYVEIDTFRGTVFLNGDQASRLDGINFELTDFFPLVVGDNDVSIDGADCDVLFNDAWL
jgi:hypothetical protein